LSRKKSPLELFLVYDYCAGIETISFTIVKSQLEISGNINVMQKPNLTEKLASSIDHFHKHVISPCYSVVIASDGFHVNKKIEGLDNYCN